MGAGTTTIGENFAGASTGVALAMSTDSFPYVVNYGLSDHFPANPIFGSGSLLLWRFDSITGENKGFFKDTAGHAAMVMNLNQAYRSNSSGGFT